MFTSDGREDEDWSKQLIYYMYLSNKNKFPLSNPNLICT